MSSQPQPLRAFLVDDDPESLHLIREQLEAEAFEGVDFDWVESTSFEEAAERIRAERFDLVATDVYRDQAGHAKNPESSEPASDAVIAWVRQHRFCPILVFSSGSKPNGLKEGPFVRWADKANPPEIVAGVRDLLGTGVPQIARRMHDDLDHFAGSYLWDFLEQRWGALEETRATNQDTLARLVRRRAAIQLGRLEGLEEPEERSNIEGAEFYLYPPIAKPLRLGEILKEKAGGKLRIVMTPHCDLVTQPNAVAPKCEFVLTAAVVPADSILNKSPAKNPGQLRKRIGAPPQLDKHPPAGRTRFLPGFLDVPDAFVDFLALESVPIADIEKRFDRVAVLDSPFAEAVQAGFVSLYARVGIPELVVERFEHLIQQGE